MRSVRPVRLPECRHSCRSPILPFWRGEGSLLFCWLRGGSSLKRSGWVVVRRFGLLCGCWQRWMWDARDLEKVCRSEGLYLGWIGDSGYRGESWRVDYGWWHVKWLCVVVRWCVRVVCVLWKVPGEMIYVKNVPIEWDRVILSTLLITSRVVVNVKKDSRVSKRTSEQQCTLIKQTSMYALFERDHRPFGSRPLRRPTSISPWIYTTWSSRQLLVRIEIIATVLTLHCY